MKSMFRFILYSIFFILNSKSAFAASGLPPVSESASPLDLLALIPKAGLFVLPLAIFAVIYFWPRIKSSKLFNRATGQSKAEILTAAGQSPVAFAAPIEPIAPQLATSAASVGQNVNIPRVSRFKNFRASVSTHKRAILTSMVVLLVLSATGGSAYYLSQRSVTQQQAAETCTPPDGKIGNDGSGGCCGSYNSKEGNSCDSGACTSSEECRISNGACASGTSCGAKECKPNGNSCSGNWECCSGGCNTTTGKCFGGSPFTPHDADQVCRDESGSVTSSCIADPNCKSNGGSCCNKSGSNFCCYGDSSTTRDGACYAGGLQNEVKCEGKTMTNNTDAEISVLRFTDENGDGKCPFSKASGTRKLVAKGSLTASCEQFDAPGKCGVCDDSNCATPPPPPPPPAATDCQCSDVQLSATTVQVGTPITITGYGWTSADTEILDKIEFKIKKNGVVEKTEEKAAARESTKDSAGKKYYKSSTTFTPASAGNYSVTIRVHWQNKNVWKE